MKISILKIISIIGLYLIFTSISHGQIKVSEIIQTSNIAKAESNQLYFVDFWATWCAPCIHAKKHLGMLQRQFPKDFYIISLSEENPATVERFLKKKPTDLAVVMDYYGETFNRFNIKALPEGILFNAKGEKLWEGHPGDLNSGVISRFLRQEKLKIGLDKFLQIVKEEEVIVADYVPTSDIEIKPLAAFNGEFEVEDTDTYLKLKGPLKSIVGYLAKIYKNQIEMSSEIDMPHEVYFKKPLNVSDNLAYKLVTKMGFGVNRKQNEGEVISFDLENARFWDTSIIDWGVNNSKYLVGDSDIKADNATLKEMTYQIAHVLDIPVIIKDEDQRSLIKHDWEMHYKFFQLMQSSLMDSYGIIVEKKRTNYPVYEITKKAP